MVAGAYWQLGATEVILTPRSRDHGRDVIATLPAVGTIRVIESVKAYGRGHLVEYDDVRALLGVVERVLADLVMPAEGKVMSLDNSLVRELYTTLTSDNPTTADWWKDWQESRKGRQAVAHKGTQMTEAKAKAAVDVAEEYMKHVTEKVDAALRHSP
jgi:Restriction endonuclease